MLTRKSTIKFENDNNQRSYTIEKKDNMLYIEGVLVEIKSVKQLSLRDEKVCYEQAKAENKNEEYATLKASLCRVFSDEMKFPDMNGNGVIFEVMDSLVLRVWSEKHIHDVYTFYPESWRIYSTTGKFFELPICGSEMVNTDFDAMFDELE